MGCESSCDGHWGIQWLYLKQSPLLQVGFALICSKNSYFDYTWFWYEVVLAGSLTCSYECCKLGFFLMKLVWFIKEEEEEDETILVVQHNANCKEGIG